MNELSLMQKFADPDIIESLTAGEKATGALITTMMGMGTTFVVLVLLWGIVALFTRMFEGKKTQVISEGISADTAAIGIIGECSEAEKALLMEKIAAHMAGGEDEDELAAVIAAAIAADMGQSTDSFVVKKISRASGFVPPWGKAGQMDSIDSRRM